MDISLRTIHLIGLLGISGGILFHVEQSLWLPYFLITVLSGLAMTLLSLWSNGIWLLQNRGLIIILKILLLLLIPVFHEYAQILLFIIVIISAISSHAPAQFRYYSPILGYRV